MDLNSAMMYHTIVSGPRIAGIVNGSCTPGGSLPPAKRRIQQHSHQHRKDGAHLVRQPLPHDAGSPLPCRLATITPVMMSIVMPAAKSTASQPYQPNMAPNAPDDGCKRSLCAIDIVVHPAPPLLAQINACDAIAPAAASPAAGSRWCRCPAAGPWACPQAVRDLLSSGFSHAGLYVGSTMTCPGPMCSTVDGLTVVSVPQPEILPLGHLGRYRGYWCQCQTRDADGNPRCPSFPSRAIRSPAHRLARLDIHLPAVHIPGDQIPGTVRRPGIPVQNANAVSQLISPAATCVPLPDA